MPFSHALHAYQLLLRLGCGFELHTDTCATAGFFVANIHLISFSLSFLSGVNRAGNQRFGNHLYWMSWQSDDPALRGANWDWFNARNYCRKRCMDLVSIETAAEYEFIKSHMGG